MTLKKSDRSALWQQHLDNFKSSGLSRAAYCRQHELKTHQLAYWLDRGGKARGHSKVAFARVVVAEPPSKAAARSTKARLYFSDSVALELDSGADPAWIAQLIRHVGGRS